MMATWRALLASGERKRMFVTIGVCLALLIVGWAVLSSARTTKAEAQKQLGAAKSAASTIETRAADLGPLIRDPDAVVRLHDELRDTGLVGEADRPRWIAALRQSLHGGPWLRTRYLLAGSETVAVPEAAQQWIDLLGEVAPTLRGQPLTLTLEGTHEGEVLDVLQRLRQSRAGGFELLDCDLRRRKDALGLDATCTLRWLSLYPAPLPEMAPLAGAPPGAGPGAKGAAP
ncbi:hypothetical protein [Cognatilysobacter bugurensis]|nr:hypothetical protein [Lysobacter bugurensis]